jgi:phosphoserine phosphatase
MSDQSKSDGSKGSRTSDLPPPYGTIVFDCDSTLVSIEGIDEIGSQAPVAAEIRRLTEEAMAGRIPLEQVYANRLALLRPSRSRLEWLGGRYVQTALPGARELIALLHGLGKAVHIVSGGLLPAVAHLARWLGVESQHVHAVDLYFEESGAFAGFDARSPLSRSGGKIEVLAALARAPGAGAIALVGDGAVDLEAAVHASRFVAFAGVARRREVVDRARVVCTEAHLSALAPLLCTEAELSSPAARKHAWLERSRGDRSRKSLS